MQVNYVLVLSQRTKQPSGYALYTVPLGSTFVPMEPKKGVDETDHAKSQVSVRCGSKTAQNVVGISKILTTH